MKLTSFCADSARYRVGELYFLHFADVRVFCTARVMNVDSVMSAVCPFMLGLQEGRKSGSIHASSGVIRGIPVNNARSRADAPRRGVPLNANVRRHEDETRDSSWTSIRCIGS